jgi:hypothetical protein
MKIISEVLKQTSKFVNFLPMIAHLGGDLYSINYLLYL